MVVVPNSLSPDLVGAAAHKAVRTGREEPLRLLFAGRMNRIKGLDILIGALAKVPDRSRYRVLALGRGPDEAEFAEMVTRLGLGEVVTFGGHVSDRVQLIEAYRDADLFVSPTRYESFGMSILEAMACGTPCAISHLSVCEETAADAALYFPMDDVEALASILVDLEETRGSLVSLSEKAWTRARAFEPEIVMPSLEAAYRTAIERHRIRVSSALFPGFGPAAKRPLVSVVIPAYNVQDYIVQAVRSAQRQTILPDEIIVADDGSSDETARRAEEAGATVLRSERGNGSIARNRGARAANGEILLFLDGDDWWHPHKVELHLLAHASNPDRSFIYDCAKIVQGSEIHAGVIGDVGPTSPTWTHFLNWRAWTSGSSFSIRRDRYWELGGFNEELIALQDVDFWIRAAQAYGSAERIPIPLTFYRVSPRSVSKTPNKVSNNLQAAFRGWPFLSERQKTEFARQVFLTAARWSNFNTGRRYLAEAGWPVHRMKFWKVTVNMALNSLRKRA